MLLTSKAAYLLTNNNYRTGVDFTKGKWLLNQLDCPGNNIEKLKAEATNFFDKNLNDRYFLPRKCWRITNPYQIPLNPNKQSLKLKSELVSII
jgi:hypothetical protein